MARRATMFGLLFIGAIAAGGFFIWPNVGSLFPGLKYEAHLYLASLGLADYPRRRAPAQASRRAPPQPQPQPQAPPRPQPAAAPPPQAQTAADAPGTAPEPPQAAAVTPPPAGAEPPAGQAPAATGDAPDVAAVAPPDEATGGEPEPTIATAATQTGPAASEPPRPDAAPEPAAVPAAPGGASAEGPHTVHLASFRSRERAATGWDILRGPNADVLGALDPVITLVDLGEKGVWYRLAAGPLESRAAADELCAVLHDRGLSCAPTAGAPGRTSPDQAALAALEAPSAAAPGPETEGVAADSADSVDSGEEPRPIAPEDAPRESAAAGPEPPDQAAIVLNAPEGGEQGQQPVTVVGTGLPSVEINLSVLDELGGVPGAARRLLIPGESPGPSGAAGTGEAAAESGEAAAEAAAEPPPEEEDAVTAETLAKVDALVARQIAANVSEQAVPPVRVERPLGDGEGGEPSTISVDDRADYFGDRYDAAKRLIRVGQADAALAIYEEVLSRRPSDRAALFGRATALHRLHRIDEAVGAYGNVLQHYPTELPALTNLLGLVGEQTPDAALERLRRLYAVNPSSAPLAAQIAMTYAQLGDAANAANFMNVAATLDQANPVYQLNLAVLYDRMGETSAAVRSYERVLQLAAVDARTPPNSARTIRERLRYLRMN